MKESERRHNQRADRRTSTSLLFSSQDELEFRLLDTKSRPGGEIEYVTDARVMMYHVTM